MSAYRAFALLFFLLGMLSGVIDIELRWQGLPPRMERTQNLLLASIAAGLLARGEGRDA